MIGVTVSGNTYHYNQFNSASLTDRIDSISYYKGTTIIEIGKMEYLIDARDKDPYGDLDFFYTAKKGDSIFKQAGSDSFLLVHHDQRLHFRSHKGWTDF